MKPVTSSSSPSADLATLGPGPVLDDRVFAVATTAKEQDRDYGRAGSSTVSKWKSAFRAWGPSSEVCASGPKKDAPADVELPRLQAKDAETIAGHPDRSWLFRFKSQVASMLSFRQIKGPRKDKGPSADRADPSRPRFSSSNPTLSARLVDQSTSTPPARSTGIASSQISSVALGLEVLVDDGIKVESPAFPSPVKRGRYSPNEVTSMPTQHGRMPLAPLQPVSRPPSPSLRSPSSYAGVDDSSASIEEVRVRILETILECLAIMVVHERNGGRPALPELPRYIIVNNPDDPLLHGGTALSHNGLLIVSPPNSVPVLSAISSTQPAPAPFSQPAPAPFSQPAPAPFSQPAPAPFSQPVPVAFSQPVMASNSIALPPALVGLPQISAEFQ